MINKLRLLFRFLRDPAEPLKPKLLIGAALLYFIMPADLLPDWIPLLGFTDDFTVLAILWKVFADVFKHYERRCTARLTNREAA